MVPVSEIKTTISRKLCQFINRGRGIYRTAQNLEIGKSPPDISAVTGTDDELTKSRAKRQMTPIGVRLTVLSQITARAMTSPQNA